MLGFETLTLAPIDRALIDARPALSAAERAWLDAYHARGGWRWSGCGWSREVRAWLEADVCAPRLTFTRRAHRLVVSAAAALPAGRGVSQSLRDGS